MHCAFNPARSTHARVSYPPSPLLDIACKRIVSIDLFRHPLAWYLPSTIYFLIDDALRSNRKSATIHTVPHRCRIDLLLNSVFFAFSSLTRLARIAAYSFCQYQLAIYPKKHHTRIIMLIGGAGRTYRSVLGGFGLAALECHSVALVLETLRGDKTLDAGGLCIGFFAFGFGLNFTADDEFADLVVRTDDQQQR